MGSTETNLPSQSQFKRPRDPRNTTNSKLTKSKSFRISTLNVDGTYSNEAYIKELLKTCDLLCIQEHWLYDFENQYLKQIDPQFTCSAKSVDMYDPIPPIARKKGHGGTAILYRKELANNIEELPEGSERTVVVKINTHPKPTILATVYCPCRGSPYTIQDFISTLDELAEITLKYQSTCDIIIAGDFNASMIKEKTDEWSIQLRQFTKELNLQTTTTSSSPTYRHNDGKRSSQIDYILTNNSKCITQSEIHTVSYLNVSPHVPVSTELIDKYLSRQKSSKTCTITKILWDQCNTELFQKYITENIDSYIPITSTSGIEKATEHLISVIIKATDLAVPSKTSRITSKPKPISCEIVAAMSESKKAYWEWKEAGRPEKDHPLTIACKEAKHKLRSAQRMYMAKRRENLHKAILESSVTNNKIFHRLISQQRKSTNSQTSELLVNNERISTTEGILEAFREHFAKLATPSENPRFDHDYKNMVDNDLAALEALSNRLKHRILPITSTEARYYISRLNTGKAADSIGMVAEHLKEADDTIIYLLARLCTAIVNFAYIPECMKDGILSPIYKKGKPNHDRNSYRGITISAILSKLLERLILQHSEDKVNKKQNDMQFGFTKGCSPNLASLVLSEAIVEQSEKKEPLYVASLDAQKAFDVIDQPSLLRKYHIAGLRGAWWNLKRLSYQNLTSRVKWEGQIGRPFPINQGSRQGGLNGATDYKTYVNKFLDITTKHGMPGYHIGGIMISTPTCADDVLLLSKTIYGLQCLLNLAGKYANQERYEIHPIKTTTSVYNSVDAKTWNEIHPWSINGRPLPVVESFTHLGINRSVTNSNTVSTLVKDRIQLARRTVYAMMGAGMHGLNGLPPITSYHLYDVHVVSRYLSNLESIILTRKDIDALEKYHRTFLKQIQHLPQRASNAAAYLLLGARPIEAQIDLKILTLFGSITRKEGSTISALAKRQLLMKTLNSKSWFIKVLELFHQYGLGSPLHQLLTPMTQTRWKKYIKKAVDYFWTCTLRQEALSKSTLQHLNIERCKIGQPHQVWNTLSDNPRDVQRAVIKARILTGVYTLQIHRKVFARRGVAEVSATCPICQKGDESIQHFLTECDEALEHAASMRYNLTELAGEDNITCEDLTQVIIDCSKTKNRSLQRCFALNPKLEKEIEVYSRYICFKIHYNRATTLGYNHNIGRRVVSVPGDKKTVKGTLRKLPQLLGGSQE